MNEPIKLAAVIIFAVTISVLFTNILAIKHDNTIQSELKIVYIHDTTYIQDTIYKELDTVFLFRSDAQFLAALTETETNNEEKLQKGYPLSNKIDASGKYYGIYQISQTYLDGCDLAQFLEFGLDDMLDPKKALITVIAKNIEYMKRAYKKDSTILNLTDLARIHAGGYYCKDRSKTDKYARKFELNLLGNDSLK